MTVEGDDGVWLIFLLERPVRELLLHASCTLGKEYGAQTEGMFVASELISKQPAFPAFVLTARKAA
jgi:hypothetical protein